MTWTETAAVILSQLMCVAGGFAWGRRSRHAADGCICFDSAPWGDPRTMDHEHACPWHQPVMPAKNEATR